MDATRKLTAICFCAALLAAPAMAQDRPNIVVIWGDDIGYWNVGAYNRPSLGCRSVKVDLEARQH